VNGGGGVKDSDRALFCFFAWLLYLGNDCWLVGSFAHYVVSVYLGEYDYYFAALHDLV